MVTKAQTQNEWSQGNRDLLVELKTQMAGVGEALASLRNEVKEIKDGMKADIEFLKNDKVSRSEITRLNVDGQIAHNDYETRLRFIERYMWGAIATVAGAVFLLNYFHPFAH